jgi:amino acid adenylation domain-containing protein
MQRVQPTNPFIPFPQDAVEQSIPARFEHIVAQYPQRVAVKTRRDVVTYAALNQMANRVAHTLLARRGEGSEPIALLLETGTRAMAAMFGVMKAGKFYTVLDSAFPQDRLTAIVQDVQPSLIVTDTAHLSLARTLADPACPVINIETLDPMLPLDNPGLALAPNSLSEIVYTSGSTGRPKGVITNHRNVLHACMRVTNVLHLSPDDRITLFASLNTSQGRMSVYRALLNGAALYPWQIRQEGVTDLAAWIRDEELTIFYASATVFRTFVTTLTRGETFPAFRLLRLGSETITAQDVVHYNIYFPPHCLLLNSLGSSETMTVCLYLLNHETVVSGNTVPVGYAAEGMEVLLLDSQGAPVAINQPGEIVIKSRYLSPGYWRQPELTAAKFRPDPSDREAQHYYTGDCGYRLPDGCLVYLGRQDAQVKIRGYRVDVTEVEQVLRAHPAIRDVVVQAHSDAQDTQRLVAYLVPHQPPGPPMSALQHSIQQHLPDYMIPAAFVFLEALPMTPSGKVARQHLPVPDYAHPQLEGPSVAPRTPIEREVARIWAEVLGLEQVGIYDPFLALGGDSLRATQVIVRVLEALHVPVSPQRLLEAPTVAQMAEFIVAHMATQMPDDRLRRLLLEVNE